MILELDLGNTRAKWRLIDVDGEVRARGLALVAEWLAGHLPAEWAGAIRCVRAASVLAAATNTALAALFHARLGLWTQFAVSESCCAGVRNAYADAATLGVDRWLALIAAYQAVQSAVLVVDAGSALTVDVADEGGQHLGGYIVPGAQLMERALFEGTDRVRFDSVAADGFGFGSHTGACVRNGIVAAQCGVILVALHEARRRLGRQPALVLSGGWGLQAADHLVALGVDEINVMPDLVLDGLRWALPG